MRRHDTDPDQASTRPEIPPGMPPQAVAMWTRLTDWLEGMGVLSATDAVEIERYARTYDFWLKAAEDIDARGEILEVNTRYGVTPRANPAVKHFMEHGRDLARIAASFGLSPAARGSLSIRPPGDPNAPSPFDPFEPAQGRKRKA